jgi:hypothetical protein
METILPCYRHTGSQTKVLIVLGLLGIHCAAINRCN